MLTGLCTALPARLGLIIIGGEGALVMGGVAAAVHGALVRGQQPDDGSDRACSCRRCWWAPRSSATSGALRALRGVNETISSLLLTYMGIALMNHLVEGPLRDPASLNKPSTVHIGEENMLGSTAGPRRALRASLRRRGLCGRADVLVEHTTFGFAARIVGGNPRAARLSGLGVGRGS